MRLYVLRLIDSLRSMSFCLNPKEHWHHVWPNHNDTRQLRPRQGLDDRYRRRVTVRCLPPFQFETMKTLPQLAIFEVSSFALSCSPVEFVFLRSQQSVSVKYQNIFA